MLWAVSLGMLASLGCTNDVDIVSPTLDAQPHLEKSSKPNDRPKSTTKAHSKPMRAPIFDPTNHRLISQVQQGKVESSLVGLQRHVQVNPEDGFARMMTAWVASKQGNHAVENEQVAGMSTLRKGAYAFWRSRTDIEREILLEMYIADACLQNHMEPSCPSRPDPVPELYPLFEQMAWVSHREDRLETWLRRSTQWDAKTVASDIGLQEGMHIADVGAGEGWFSVPFAEVVGETGRVYGVEIDRSYKEFLDFVSTEFNLPQLQGIQSDSENPNLPTGTLDIVFVCEVMKAVVTDQQVQTDPTYYERVALPFVQNLVAGLKSNGRLVFIEHDMPEGVLKGTSEALLRRLIEDAGLKVVERGTQYGPLQLMLIAER